MRRTKLFLFTASSLWTFAASFVPPAPIKAARVQLYDRKFNRELEENALRRAAEERSKKGAFTGETAAGAVLGSLVFGPFGALFGASMGSGIGNKRALDRARKEEMERMGITPDMLKMAEDKAVSRTAGVKSNRELEENALRRAAEERSKKGAFTGETAAGAVLGTLVFGPFGALFGASMGSGIGNKRALDRARREEMERMGITPDMLKMAEDEALSGTTCAFFENQAAVLRGAQKNFLRRFLPRIFDERDFVAFGEALRFIIIKGDNIFVFTEETDVAPLFAIPLQGLKATIEDPNKPDKNSTTISPTGKNIAKSDMVTVLLKYPTGKISYQFTFNKHNDEEIAQRFVDAIDKSGPMTGDKEPDKNFVKWLK